MPIESHLSEDILLCEILTHTYIYTHMCAFECVCLCWIERSIIVHINVWMDIDLTSMQLVVKSTLNRVMFVRTFVVQ